MALKTSMAQRSTSGVMTFWMQTHSNLTRRVSPDNAITNINLGAHSVVQSRRWETLFSFLVLKDGVRYCRTESLEPLPRSMYDREPMAASTFDSFSPASYLCAAAASPRLATTRT